MKPEVRSVYREQMHFGRCRSPGVCRTHVCPSLAYKTEPIFITEEKRVPFHSPVDSFTTLSSAWRCRRVSSSVARGTRDLSPAASRLFPIALGETAVATYSRIYSLNAVRAATAPVLAQCIDLDVHLYYMAIQNLVNGCGNV